MEDNEGSCKGDRGIESSSQEQQSQIQGDSDSFVWDESSQLYYHPRSGFYHNPNAGWYYSTRDGLYYKFEDGGYALLDSHESDQSNIIDQGESSLSGPQKTREEQEYSQNNEENKGFWDPISSEETENHPPPSEWLEDTLIELYLSGYSNTASNASDHLQLPLSEEIEVGEQYHLAADGHSISHGQGDGEWNSDCQGTDVSSVDEGASWDEENWRAQYGQVVEEESELCSGVLIVDMWDWSIIRETQKKVNREAVRLVGRLVQPSRKLHPSVASGGGRLRTAPICKVHLDLVQVRSGQVYKLRSANIGYLATLSSYDASNPTKDWGFPKIPVETINESSECKTAIPVYPDQNTHSYRNQLSESEKQDYRDRAAERRMLHGGFGVGPGQKRRIGEASPPSSPPVEEAAAEALEMSFGIGSYAHKILKNMGWKEGQALGKTQQGLREPLQGVGNVGTAGLGWASICRTRK